LEGRQLSYRWVNCVPGFNLPIKVSGITSPDKTKWLKPTTEWQIIKIPNKYSNSTLTIDRNFYVGLKQFK
jgi:hypothetical protein